MKGAACPTGSCGGQEEGLPTAISEAPRHDTDALGRLRTGAGSGGLVGLRLVTNARPESRTDPGPEWRSAVVTN